MPLYPGALLVPGVAVSSGSEKTSIGLVEDVVLLPWQVRLPARVDTGATTTSLDARNLSVAGDVADFNLPEKYGGQHLRLPIVGWRTVRSAKSQERRPVVEVELCLGPRRIRIHANLTDRSRLTYPLLIGRNVLRKGFLVDCMKNHCTSPACPEVKGQ